MGLFNTLRFITSHPLNAGRGGNALLRFAQWQIGSRILPGGVAMPFVNGTRLLVTRGMTGATGNVYSGLHEFEDMSFVLHALRPGDLFVDVGANVGSYTILACSTGAQCVAVEPVPSTFAALIDNVRLNGYGQVTDARNIAVSSAPGTVRMTSNLDSCNHLVNERGGSQAGVIQVEASTLDLVLDGRRPAIIKIDVEGLEADVLGGGARTLQSTELKALIVELNGNAELHEWLLSAGFAACLYAPLTRELRVWDRGASASGNVLYVRDVDLVRERVRGARPYGVRGRSV